MSAEKSREPEKTPIATRVRQAAASAANLAILGGSVLCGAFFETWSIVIAGAAAYAAMVAWDVVGGEPKPALAPARAPVALLPDPVALADDATKDAAAALIKARAHLDGIVAATSKEVTAQLAAALESLDELQARAVALIGRSEDLARHLREARADHIRQEIAKLEAKAGKTADDAAKRQFQGAIETRLEQLRTLEEIDKAKDRIIANLARIEATFEGLASKIVQMRAMDAEAMDWVAGDMNQELEHMKDEMVALEETLRTLGMMEAARV